jgi:peptidoglycan/LPS O-acetylase OafA/YrhL
VTAVVPPAWSLVVEVQYYLLLPLFALALALVAPRSVARAAVVVAVFGALALALRLVTVTQTQPSAVWRYSLPANAVFFVPGLMLALLRVRWDETRPVWTRRSRLAEPAVWLAAGATLFLVVFWRYSWDALLLPACFLIVGACVLPLRSHHGLHWLDARPLVLVGVASYSLYLWHEPIVHRLSRIDAMSSFGSLLTVSAVLCLAVAAMSYAGVEARFLRLRR